MNSFLKTVLYSLLQHASFKGAVVLMYHSIAENKEFFTVTPLAFEMQMKYLREHSFNVIDLNLFAKIIKEKKDFPPKTIVVTFDDGYEDNYINALPILKKYNIPATVFISTSYINKNINARKGTVLRGMKEEQIKELFKSGIIEVGSHSNEHVKLKKLNNEKINMELSVSSNTLYNIMGQRPVFLAYPSGSVDDKVKTIASRYFILGCGVKKGRVVSGSDYFDIKRNSIDSETTFLHFKGIVKFGRL